MDIFLSKCRLSCFEYLFTGHTVYLEKGKKSGLNMQGIRVIPIENKINIPPIKKSKELLVIIRYVIGRVEEDKMYFYSISHSSYTLNVY